jgi:ADP-ribose pyrophosphatase
VTAGPNDIPQVTSSARPHEGWVTIRVDSVRYPSGREGTIDVVEHPRAVVLVPIDGQGRLFFVRQYRHATARRLLELPAGGLEPGEAIEVCAQRELQEETGFRAAHIERLGGFFTAPGYCDEYLHVFLASGLSESALAGDEEHIEPVAVPLDDALRMVASGEIEDAKSVAALLMYLQLRGLVSAE